MSIDPKNSLKGNYYSGGLAELVASPTILTCSFLQNWLTGAGSVGKAMELLGLPVEKNSLPLVELTAGGLMVNLTHEEATLYAKTIFSYAPQKNLHDQPHLVIDIKKLFNPFNLITTARIVLVQSNWIAKPADMVKKAQQLIQAIPEYRDQPIEELDTVLRNDVWSVVISVGMLSEFYAQFVAKEAKDEVVAVQEYMSSKLAARDWFFTSIADLEKVKAGELSFKAYIDHYGLRADKDYELTCPRWYEILEIIKKRITTTPVSKNLPAKTVSLNNKLLRMADTSVDLQILRSQAKQKALAFIDALRKKILAKTKKMKNIQFLTREEIFAGTFSPAPSISIKVKKTPQKKTTQALSGKGTSVSVGEVRGIAHHITSTTADVAPGTIGIFPNASPEFATQYPKCTGMIFQRGGQTSHGSIVAREFGIPALIDHSAVDIIEGIRLTINGATGEWNV